jgi:four helix bundle protein
MKVNRFEDLEIWKEARELCKFIKKLTTETPLSKDYKLRDQMRDSSGSIMDNIAEGFERGGNKEFSQFLSISKGSCGEIRSQGYRAYDFEYITQDSPDEIFKRTLKLSSKISRLMTYLKNSDFKGYKYYFKKPPEDANEPEEL